MNRDGHNSVEFFIGPEVEHTPAYSKRTLFVVGRQELATIEKHARENRTPHIFMGANHSFDIDPAHPDNTLYLYWDKTITELINRGYTVTLDYQAHLHDHVLKMLSPAVWQSRLFVPLLSVRVPRIETSSPNLTIKIDDIDFNATNRGVWCIHFREVTDSNRFTDWQDYESDLVLSSNVEPTKIVNRRHELKAEVPVPAQEEPKVQEVLNQPALGLDVEAKTLLKSEENVEVQVATVINSPKDAAAAYADGATADPLRAEAPKKPKGKQ
jgi:hypothetical protein